MAGLGRRTHYRKHLTDSIIYDFPEPRANELVAKVVATRGGNQFDIILARAHQEKESSVGDVDYTPADDDSEHKHKPQLAILPTKFNKLVWVKRNDFVIVETVMDQEDEEKNEEEESTANCNQKKKKDHNIHDGIRFRISHILYKDQVKHLQSKGLWPTHDNEFSAGGVRSSGEEVEDESDLVEAGDGINYDMGFEEDDEYFVNTNRLANLKVDDSSDSESSDEES